MRYVNILKICGIIIDNISDVIHIYIDISIIFIYIYIYINLI